MEHPFHSVNIYLYSAAAIFSLEMSEMYDRFPKYSYVEAQISYLKRPCTDAQWKSIQSVSIMFSKEKKFGIQKKLKDNIKSLFENYDDNDDSIPGALCSSCRRTVQKICRLD